MSGTSPSPPSLRNNGLSLFTQAVLADHDKSLTLPEPEAVADNTDKDSDTSDSFKESSDMGDNVTSPLPAGQQRRLPIPSTGANSSPNLKGMLIKPKRILPQQPDTFKAKRAAQDGGLQSKQHTTADLKSPREQGNAGESVTNNLETPHKQTILPKLQIDVDRLKTYFLHNGNEGSEARKPSVNVKDIGLKKSRLGGNSSGSLPTSYLTRESTLYNFSPDGVTKVREWCSQGEINKVTSKMSSSDNAKDRNIRSPSPKSNTTWDRSSSGYSSDERADPRSPPPRDAANGVSKTESTKVGEFVSVNNQDNADADTTKTVEQDISAKDSVCDIDDSDNDTCGGDDVVEAEEDSDSDTNEDDKDSSNVCSCAVSEGANNNTDKTDQNQNNLVVSKEENVTIGPSITGVDSSPGIKPMTRRTTWQPASGRIQYRKSPSESTISLRHPSRQGLNGENNFDGLEVWGRSYPQVPNATAKADSFVSEGGKADAARVDSSTPSSAFTPVEKSPVTTDNLIEPMVVPKLDIPKPEPVFKTRMQRQQFAPPRSPRAIKNLSLSLTGTLTIGRDEKDIRKTLHDLNSPRRSSPGGQMVPIRARHVISSTSGSANQPMKATDSSTMGLSFSSFQGVNTVADNKSGVKFFGKKMWRAPQGQPENAQMRPFSPFGGTLPPSKIKESAQRRHDSEHET